MMNRLAGALSIAFCLMAESAIGLQVSNSVITLGISGTRGSSIDSFKIGGVETIDINDLGREVQASVFVSYNAPAGSCPDGRTFGTATYVNPTEAGDTCGLTSNVYAIGTAGSNISVGAYVRDWNGRGFIPGFAIEGHHQVGPLSYMAQPEVARLTYYIISDQVTSTMVRYVGIAGGIWTPVNFMPAIYFKGNVLTRLYGLSINGSTWTEVTSSVFTAPTTEYQPSLYRYRAMAWMSPSLGSGVALYGRWTTTQSCPVSYPMTRSDQAGQCPNFAAEKFPNATPGVVGGTNNISLIDQTLTTIPARTYAAREAHLVVGNLATIKAIVNGLYNAGH